MEHMDLFTMENGKAQMLQ